MEQKLGVVSSQGWKKWGQKPRGREKCVARAQFGEKVKVSGHGWQWEQVQRGEEKILNTRFQKN